MELWGRVLIRYFWMILGLISFCLGTIGIILPILPTVPFYLLTVYCLAKGSKKIHKWFLGTVLYKKYLADFMYKRAMSIFNKFRIICTVTIIMMLGYYFMLSGFAWTKYVMMIIWLIHVIYLFFCIKTKKY